MNKKIKYAQVGLGSRSNFFYESIIGKYKDKSELVAFCDTNQTRMNYANSVLMDKYNLKALPTYSSDNFEEMIKNEKPDIIVVTSIDRTHDKYIVKAMELGCDVITEKPLTINECKAQKILNTVKNTGRKLRVTFNYRYSPYNSKIKELIDNNTIGKVNSIHFEWLLNTSHGADYFRRWHRDKKNSGGLLVHKSTHHFDLINFWISSTPKTVFSMGDLMFYGKENAEENGFNSKYYRASNNPLAANDHFALDMTKNERLKALYLDAEHEDGYLRDQNVFGDGINIEDTIGVLVKYKNNAILTYSLNAYTPYEGYKICFNGTKGRIEATSLEQESRMTNVDLFHDSKKIISEIKVFPMFGKEYNVDFEMKEGGHGGGDPALLEDLFGTPKPDPLNRAASHYDGLMSILTGIAANKSINTGNPIDIDTLLKF
ncbi:MAG: Gfo/Idh/MocA family oxidoreductase [Clostridiales bacterium]